MDWIGRGRGRGRGRRMVWWRLGEGWWREGGRLLGIRRREMR